MCGSQRTGDVPAGSDGVESCGSESTRCASDLDWTGYLAENTHGPTESRSFGDGTVMHARYDKSLRSVVFDSELQQLNRYKSVQKRASKRARSGRSGEPYMVIISDTPNGTHPNALNASGLCADILQSNQLAHHERGGLQADTPN